MLLATRSAEWASGLAASIFLGLQEIEWVILGRYSAGNPHGYWL
jgi:hypothetical protein